AGAIRPLGPVYAAPTGQTHRPQLWTERMTLKPDPWKATWVDRLESLVDNKWELPMARSGPHMTGSDD
ncbi:MAG: dehydrogenase, partial [Deinococcus sp.]|nr:dehydrogenase [Deinococcus sp.]